VCSLESSFDAILARNNLPGMNARRTLEILKERGVDVPLVIIIADWMEEILQYQGSLVERVKDAIISTDLDLKVISWNAAARQIYGWKPGKCLANRWTTSLNRNIWIPLSLR
jgi:PAS domain-containing protein